MLNPKSFNVFRGHTYRRRSSFSESYRDPLGTHPRCCDELASSATGRAVAPEHPRYIDSVRRMSAHADSLQKRLDAMGAPRRGGGGGVLEVVGLHLLHGV